ncbi:Heat shock protein 75 kDa, mitochondrial [Galemys pyrenaicus]|uniref:Heat shock protein 75 kDa, mitochondrial n=1 Tax=Galemys pyrenaicus TaxID=202257 RepID=A0A8J5ZSB3_GALPY|nr:Heat shock protein 75 kDa, mitochondrial [Galemys pyrenaicus]
MAHELRALLFWGRRLRPPPRIPALAAAAAVIRACCPRKPSLCSALVACEANVSRTLETVQMFCFRAAWGRPRRSDRGRLQSPRPRDCARPLPYGAGEGVSTRGLLMHPFSLSVLAGRRALCPWRAAAPSRGPARPLSSSLPASRPFSSQAAEDPKEEPLRPLISSTEAVQGTGSRDMREPSSVACKPCQWSRVGAGRRELGQEEQRGPGRFAFGVDGSCPCEVWRPVRCAPAVGRTEAKTAGSKALGLCLWLIAGSTSKHEFQAETKKLLDIVARSLYSEKEVFVRELISNASDALEKLRHKLVSAGQTLPELEIHLQTDPEKGTLTVQDTGIGMTQEELVSNLGTIARSGSKAFLDALQNQAEASSKIIGQFGVGFYSAFMVADSVEVYSRSAEPGSPGYQWRSDGSGVFEIAEASGVRAGTKIIVHLKSDNREFASEARIRGEGSWGRGDRGCRASAPRPCEPEGGSAGSVPPACREQRPRFVPPTLASLDVTRALGSSVTVGTECPGASWHCLLSLPDVVTKYSNFVSFPLYLNGRRVNTLQAVWMLDPKDVGAELHEEFYRYVAQASDRPRYTLHYKTDAPLSIRSIFYVPETKPSMFDVSRELGSSISLYSRKVLIQTKAADILPKWLRFLRGVVDSEDMPLNLSRELLQESALVRKLRDILQQRLIKFFIDQSKKDPEKYAKFFDDYGLFMREGIVTTAEQAVKVGTAQGPGLLWGSGEGQSLRLLGPAPRRCPPPEEDIAKLLRYESSALPAGQLTSLLDYAGRMQPGSRSIYYLCAPTRQLAEHSPYYEAMKRKRTEVLFCYEQFDELALLHLREFDRKQLVSVETDIVVDHYKEEKFEDAAPAGERLSEQEAEDLMAWMRNALGSRVTNVKVTLRLDTHPAMVTVLEMGAARHFLRMQQLAKTQEERAQLLQPTLEINPRRDIYLLLLPVHSAAEPKTRVESLPCSPVPHGSVVRGQAGRCWAAARLPREGRPSAPGVPVPGAARRQLWRVLCGGKPVLAAARWSDSGLPRRRSGRAAPAVSSQRRSATLVPERTVPPGPAGRQLPGPAPERCPSRSTSDGWARGPPPALTPTAAPRVTEPPVVARALRVQNHVTQGPGSREASLTPGGLRRRHALIRKLSQLREHEPELAQLLVDQVYENAMITAGLVDDPRPMVGRLNALLVKALERR